MKLVPACSLMHLSFAVIFGAVVVSGISFDINKTTIDNLARNIAVSERTFFSTLNYYCDPIKKYLGLLPDDQSHNCLDTSHINLRLYTQLDEYKDFNASLGGLQILNHSMFNRSLPTVFYVFGYSTNITFESVKTMVKELLERELNVIVLDSSSIIFKNYLKSSTNVLFAGKIFGKVLADMYNGAGINLNITRIVGLSLGAHISGIAGKTFKKLTGVVFSRITGLDPAGPCFFDTSSDYMLSNDDAEFIDVIHTDSGVFGIIQPLGHADFYPNNGEAQPYCIMLGCSHTRSLYLYIESINHHDHFLATACTSWSTYLSGECDRNEKVNMGYSLPKNIIGIYFLKTHETSPYSLSQGISVPRSLNLLKMLIYSLILLIL